VLLANELARGYTATPLHVRCGLAWEGAEGRTLGHLLCAPPFAGRANALVTLTADVTDVYPCDHWALAGTPPAYETPDADVYLEGRNLLLITKAAVWCRRQDVSRLVIGSLAGNPFPDATPEFFAAMSSAIGFGLAHQLEVAAPFLTMSKREVMTMGRRLGVPLESTLSCMNPRVDDSHCHACSKCRERATGT
jgi:7-cyano-7-deazaguanine synthase